MTKAWLVVLLVALPGLTLADEDLPGAIEGSVTDQSGAPVAGATVYAKSEDLGGVAVITNAQGRFLIKAPAGKVEIVGIFGRARVDRSMTVVAGRTNHLDIQLDPGAGETITIHEHLGGRVPLDPRPVQNYGRLKLPYSDDAIDEDIWASAWLLLHIDELGRVDAVRFARHAGHGLDEIAVKQAFTYRFRPARDEDGRPVRAILLWKMEWRPYWRDLEIVNPGAGGAFGLATGGSGPASARPFWPSAGLAGSNGPTCAGAGPMNLGETFPTYRDCSQPDLQAAMREPIIMNPAIVH